MPDNFTLVFDDVIVRQLRKIAKNKPIKNILSKMFDRLEETGPQTGKLLDPHLLIYELKNMHPPIRLYFKHNVKTNEIYVFEFEIKTSQTKQAWTIDKIRKKSES